MEIIIILLAIWGFVGGVFYNYAVNPEGEGLVDVSNWKLLLVSLACGPLIWGNWLCLLAGKLNPLKNIKEFRAFVEKTREFLNK